MEFLSSLSSYQIAASETTGLILLAYLLLLSIRPTAAKGKALAGFLLCAAVSYSPLYDLLNNVQYYSLFCLIYLATAKSVTNKKIKCTLIIMSIFGLSMSVDRFINAGTVTWLYENFEAITCCIHCLILLSSIKFKPISIHGFMGRFVDSMRDLSRMLRINSAV